VNRVAEQLQRASRVCCLTGAGISAESGVPTFRGAGGFWAEQRAEDLATPEGFQRDPEKVWKFYLWRRDLLRQVQPNPAHEALAKMQRGGGQLTVVTQNIDDLHRLAGSRDVIELHGNLWVDLCTRCGASVHRSPGDWTDEIPICGTCGLMMRPGVVWFGEALSPERLGRAQEAAGDCDVMLVVGTSGVVQPAASLANWAKSNGAFVVEINPDQTPLSHLADVRLRDPAGEVLPRIASVLEND